MDEFITGLDIGSNTIRIIVGQNIENEYGDIHLQILSAIESPSQGIEKGKIISIDDTVSSISKAVEKTEQVLGQSLDSVWVSLSASGIVFQENKGVVSIANPDKEVNAEDVSRVIETAKMISLPINYEILHVLPKHFIVDDQTGIKDPIGMSASRLEVETQIIQCSNTQSKNLRKSIHRTSLDINGLVLSTLAASEAVLSEKQKKLGVVLVDFGASSTNILVYEDGDILHSASIPLGSNHITSDIAIVLRTSLETAENIKLEHGYAFAKSAEDIDIDLSLISDDKGFVSKKDVSRIIQARLEEIFSKINNELSKIKRKALLPAGVVFVGGGSRLAGILDLAKESLQLPAILGQAYSIHSNTDKVYDVAFATALGLVKWGSIWEDEIEESRYLSKSVDKLKSWFKNILP